MNTIGTVPTYNFSIYFQKRKIVIRSNKSKLMSIRTYQKPHSNFQFIYFTSTLFRWCLLNQVMYLEFLNTPNTKIHQTSWTIEKQTKVLPLSIFFSLLFYCKPICHLLFIYKNALIHFSHQLSFNFITPNSNNIIFIPNLSFLYIRIMYVQYTHHTNNQFPCRQSAAS